MRLLSLTSLLTLLLWWYRQLGYNQIPFFDDVTALTALPHLSTLYLEHNPIARDFEYRMRLRRMVPTLTQLDATRIV